jgi:hypothetical protein
MAAASKPLRLRKNRRADVCRPGGVNGGLLPKAAANHHFISRKIFRPVAGLRMAVLVVPWLGWSA